VKPAGRKRGGKKGEEVEKEAVRHIDIFDVGGGKGGKGPNASPLNR